MSDTHGKSISRVGDRVTCPVHGHGGVVVIVSGDPTFVIDGQAVARHGDKTSCGATLIAGQVVSFVDNATNSGRRAFSATSEFVQATPASHFDEQVELIAKLAFAEGLPYYVEADGQNYSGRVGADHKLPRIETASKGSYEVFVGDEALAMIQGNAP